MAEAQSKDWSPLLQQEKEIRGLLGEKPACSALYLHGLLASFRCNCQGCLLQCFEKAQKKNLEHRLWDVHGLINTHYRNQLKRFRGSDGKKKRVEKRKIERVYLDFIKKSQHFYRSYLQNLHAQFGCLRDLEAIAPFSLLSKEFAPICDDLNHLLLLSCHQSLIRLGDLSRWRETQLQTQTRNRNWGPARGYYDLASRINPASAESSNQLAVIALQETDHLETVYCLYLTMIAKEPHPCAKNNLEAGFRKLEATWSKNEEQKGKVTPNLVASLDKSFVRLHIYCYKGDVCAKVDELEDYTLMLLETNVRGRSVDSVLLRIVLINIAAASVANERLRENPESPEVQQSYQLLQRLNVKTLRVLLAILRSELEVVEDSEPPAVTGEQVTEGAKISGVARRVLPALRLYSRRIMTDKEASFGSECNVGCSSEAKAMWRAFADILNLLTSLFPLSEACDLDYLLQEDESTLGLSLFGHEDANSRPFSTPRFPRRPRDSRDLGDHDTIKTVKRLHDLLFDGLAMQKNKVIPIIAGSDGGVFRFLEDAKSTPLKEKELRRSKAFPDEEIVDIDRTILLQSVSTASHSLSAPEPMELSKEEVTHVEETTFPHQTMMTSSVPVLMDVDSKLKLDKSNTEGTPRDGRQEGPRVTSSGQLECGETSHGLLVSTTALGQFGDAEFRARQPSTSILPKMKNSRYASPTRQHENLKASLEPTHLASSMIEPQGREIGSMPQQQHQTIRVPSSNSALPTPTFEQSGVESFHENLAEQHPKERARQVQKALDASKFISSNIFPDSTCEPDEGG